MLCMAKPSHNFHYLLNIATYSIKFHSNFHYLKNIRSINSVRSKYSHSQYSHLRPSSQNSLNNILSSIFILLRHLIFVSCKILAAQSFLSPFLIANNRPSILLRAYYFTSFYRNGAKHRGFASQNSHIRAQSSLFY